MTPPSTAPSDTDTIVVAARNETFQTVFLGENRWHRIRIHSSMLDKIKHIAVYRVAPIAAITHVAPIKDIRRWEGTYKYVLNFAAPAQEIGPIKLMPGGRTRAPQSPRYTSLARLMKAATIDEVF